LETSDVQTAKVFKNGRSQAIRLPKEFRVNAGEVYLKRTPEGFLVVPRDPWEVFLEGVEELSDEFMAEGRQEPEAQTRNWRS
jgi:antitoxin VapB